MNFYTKLFSFVSTGLLLVLILASPASAHDPLILLPEQKTPLNGPFLPDGTISFALYGSLLEKNDTRAFQFYLDSDDRLDISLLIPNLEPENQMPEEKLPRLFLYRPDGSKVEGISDLYIPFDEPFSMTRYVRIFEYVEKSSGGVYQVEVTGINPVRFTVAIGYIESFGTPVENVPNREAGRTGIFDWYQNPVEEKPPETLLEETVTTTIQESIPETTAPVIEKTTETLVEETVTTTIQESIPETTAPVIEKTTETLVEETVTTTIQERTPEITGSTDTSSTKIFIPVIAGLVTILLLAKTLKREKSSN
jgi:hypothetical protein